jgi:hypothetical protein
LQEDEVLKDNEEEKDWYDKTGDGYKQYTNDDSINTIGKLRIIKTEDADKIMQMDKHDIMKYYEDMIDKCHLVIY